MSGGAHPPTPSTQSRPLEDYGFIGNTLSGALVAPAQRAEQAGRPPERGTAGVEPDGTLGDSGDI